MKKKICLLLGVLFFSSMFLIACGGKSEVKENKTIKVVVPDGIPAMGIGKLIKEKESFYKGYNVDYSIEKMPDNIVSSVLKGEADIAIVPSNIAATQYNKKAGYKIAGTVGWGSFYIVSPEAGDLANIIKNKEVYNIGRGLTPDIVTRTILRSKGFNIESDVKFSYVNSANELPAVILNGKAKIAVIPEPALSTVLAKKSDLNIIANLNEEWKSEYNSEFGFPQSTIIVKESLLNEDKSFVEKFLEKVNESVEWANDNHKELAFYCEEIGVSANKDIIPMSIKNANLKFAPINSTKEEYKNYFKTLNEFDPKTIGGSIPDEGVFME